MFDEKFKKQLIVLLLVVVSIVLAIFILIKLQEFNHSNEIIIRDNNSDSTISNSIKVDIRGAVKDPGVYEFNEGQITEEALEKAGGLTEEADVNYIDKNINRASKLVNEQKIYVPAKDENRSLSTEENVVSSEVMLEKININTGSKEDLMSLPGIGEAYAKRIIESRPYKGIEEIKNVKGIGDSMYEKFKDKITI